MQKDTVYFTGNESTHCQQEVMAILLTVTATLQQGAQVLQQLGHHEV